MRYKLLGKSGLRVSQLALGTMTFGEEWGWGASRDECRRLYEAYRADGGNFVDTANKYTEGSSEQIVGELIGPEREEIVLATKYSLTTNPGDPNGGGSHRKHVVQALDASLKRLGTDYIDLYWLHAWDYLTPIEEVMRALDDQVRAGKILYVGVSDTPAWIVSRANAFAELRAWTPFVGLQIPYSLVERTVERDLIPMARALDLAVTAWGPLGSGLLSGKYTRGGDAAPNSRLNLQGGVKEAGEQKLAIAGVLHDVADELHAPPATVAIAWLLHQQDVTIPIVGARRLDQLQQNLAAVDLHIPMAQLDRLNTASHIDRGFPHEFFHGDMARGLMYGNKAHLIDDHRRQSPFTTRTAASPSVTSETT
jgi:aryl-alcohol dehydrogenase-like predicted oxidoreductase